MHKMVACQRNAMTALHRPTEQLLQTCTHLPSSFVGDVASLVQVVRASPTSLHKNSRFGARASREHVALGSRDAANQKDIPNHPEKCKLQGLHTSRVHGK